MQPLNRPPFIYIVDDDQMYRHVIDKTLKSELDARVVCFSSADEARESLEKETLHPDLIILDLELPGTGGHEFLNEIKADKTWAEIPVIVITSHDSTELQVETLSDGADDFVEKGESSAVVVGRIKSQLRHKWAHDHLHHLAQKADRFAHDVLEKIDTRLDAGRKLVEVAEQAVGESQKSLQQALQALNEAGNDLSKFTNSILLHKEKPNPDGP